MKRVLLGMSGGVDSSMTALKLQNLGFNVEGVYLKLHKTSDEYHNKNIDNIDKVCNKLDIKYRVLDFQKEFDKEIMEYFVDSYKAGLTPNPCVVCNQNIKFGLLFDYMADSGFDYLATGHYARIEDGFIVEALDKTKDQSYFLSRVKKSVLDRVIFPLEDTIKTDLKDNAKNLSDIFDTISNQKESSGICFVDSNYTDILSNFFETNISGNVKNISGDIVGKHNGYTQYTIGKRRGFSVKGAHKPHYVLSIDSTSNEIVVGEQEELKKNVVLLNDVISHIDKSKFLCQIKLRYRQQKNSCRIVINNSYATVYLDEPVYGVASGQVGVLYDNDRVIGSGFIYDSTFCDKSSM